MRPRYRKIILFSILGAVVTLVVLDPMSEKTHTPSSPVLSRPHGSNETVLGEGEAKGESRTLGLTLPEHRTLSETNSELFGPQSWQPPPSRRIAAPVVPTAPPLPYKFAGKLLQEGRLQVFLSKGDAAIPISQGEILDGRYRVESIGEDRITLIYLPLGLKESIPVSSALQTAGTSVMSTASPADGNQTGIGTISTGSVIASAPAASGKKTESTPPQLIRDRSGGRSLDSAHRTPAGRTAAGALFQ